MFNSSQTNLISIKYRYINNFCYHGNENKTNMAAPIRQDTYNKLDSQQLEYDQPLLQISFRDDNTLLLDMNTRL